MLLDFIILLFYITVFSKIDLKLCCLFSPAGFCIKVDVAFLNALGNFLIVFSFPLWSLITSSVSSLPLTVFSWLCSLAVGLLLNHGSDYHF